MASYIGSDQELLCPICASFYNTPRKLPGCVHSFCEKCIVTLLQNLKSDEKLDEEFECPVCRLPSKSPKNDTTDISKWVQELDIDKELQTKVGKQNEQDAKWCGQCRYVEKFIKSEVYCSTCQESFCGKCSEMLHSFKMNRDHAIIDIKANGENETINEQAVQLLQTFLTCSSHSEKRVEYFCPGHNRFCCVNCVTNGHQGCRNISSLDDLMEKKNHGVDNDNNYDKDDDDNDEDNIIDSAKLLGSLSTLNNHIKSVVKLIKENDAETKKTPEKLKTEFQGIKEKVLRLLDAAEEEIFQDSKALSKAISMKSLDEIELLNAVSSEIGVVTYLLHTLVPKLPSDSAMVCHKSVEWILQGLERKVLEKGSSFETEELHLNIEVDFDTIINLGPNETENIVSVKKYRKHHPLPRYNDKFLLREGRVEVVDVKHNCISDISPGEVPGYNSITFLSDNTSIVLTDSYYGICLLLDANSDPADSISFKVKEVTRTSTLNGNFIHSAYLANDLLAISILCESKICLVSANDGRLDKKSEFYCKHKPTAIYGLQNGDLCILWEEPDAFGIISLCDGSYKDKVFFERDTGGKSIHHNRRLVVDEDRHHMICAYRKKSNEAGKITAIASYDFDGNKVFDNSILEIKDPRGMALDADGNIYICDLDQGKIHVLSPDGIHIRMINEGCPEQPLGIGFSKSTNVFAVTQWTPGYQKVVLFSIEPP